MRNLVLFILAVMAFSWSSPKPMEPLDHYNVVLVHGAAPSGSGFESMCGGDIDDAYTVLQNNMRNPDSNKWNLGGAAGMMGAYNDGRGEKLTYWLDSAVFENYQYRDGSIYMDSLNLYGSPSIYIQRSFANPAASPAHNALEIGDRTWKGEGNCKVRRALFEEAQEVRAKGQERLDSLRRSSDAEYRSIPSRNILIAHSMGGVASHEYVTDETVYNDDVDKLITLDSPHEGTGSLNMLIDMRDYGRQTLEATSQFAFAWAIALVVAGKDPISETTATDIIALTFGMSAVNRIVTTLVDNLALKDDYGYEKNDALTKYIYPDADGITSLKNRPAYDKMPMVRLLAGKGGMTFSDPNEGFRYTMNIIVPEAISTPVMNIGTQLNDGDGSSRAVYVNSVTGMVLGFGGGIALQDVGTTLIPEKSGLAFKTKAFESPDADLRRFTFDAAANANDMTNGKYAAVITENIATLAATVSGIIVADIALSVYPSWLAAAVKTGVAVAGAALLGLEIADTGVEDIMTSHENAKARRMLDTLYSTEFSYSKITAGNESGKVLLMEDFLYEKPFVNLGLFVSADSLREVDPSCYYESAKADKEQLCEIGLYGTRDSIKVDSTKKVADNGVDSLYVHDTTHVYNVVNDKGDSVYYGPFKRENYTNFQKSPVTFKSATDWGKMGVKVDRWTRVGMRCDGGHGVEFCVYRTGGVLMVQGGYGFHDWTEPEV